jgi:hypothetical protein
MKIITPTINYQNGHFKVLPFKMSFSTIEDLESFMKLNAFSEFLKILAEEANINGDEFKAITSISFMHEEIQEPKYI